MSEYPEHDKLTAIADQSQAIGEFLEWLGAEKGVQLMTWVEQDEQVPCPGTGFRECIDGFQSHPLDEKKATSSACMRCGGKGTVNSHFEGWVPQPTPVTSLLAEHFGINEKTLEQEKRAMLRAMTND